MGKIIKMVQYGVGFISFCHGANIYQRAGAPACNFLKCTRKIVSFGLLFITLLLADSSVSFAREIADDEIPIVIIPSKGETAYSVAGEEFADMWNKITGHKPVVINEDSLHSLPVGKVVIIGSDAVNHKTHEFIRKGVFDSLGIRYGSDDYRILSFLLDRSQVLVLAGGSGRSTLYAVYDFFHRNAGAQYFWDGDIVPHQKKISIKDVNVIEKPRFEYRGLRYFAHRGLHRFHPEMWTFEDWKREIDWMLKKRLNLFMLRIGIDDLFQRTFRDVPYPPTDGIDADAHPRSYEDRTTFWPLRYRGELRKKILKYARDRGLLNPIDAGTITHWYSSTPSSFYKNRPDFPVMTNQKKGYFLPKDAVWDIESQRTWDSYWKLSGTIIKEFNNGHADLFHTIGLAERVFGTERENLQSKLYTYRKTEEMIHRNFPTAKLLIGNWDFLWWNKDDVRNVLLKEFDPSKTIILSYLEDIGDFVPYKEYGYYKQFPWIFGVLHSLNRHSDIHSNYNILSKRIEDASKDSFCKGMVVWPEISHDDNFFIEYMTRNSWLPNTLNITDATETYCNERYGVNSNLSTEMNKVWSSFLPLSQLQNFTHNNDNKSLQDWLFSESQFRILTYDHFKRFKENIRDNWEEESADLKAALMRSKVSLDIITSLCDSWYNNEFWRRDALDIARTTASRALFFTLNQGLEELLLWEEGKSNRKKIGEYSKLSQEILKSFTSILSLSDDFSLDASFKGLSNAFEINGIPPTLNPHSELTLKGNTENSYCRKHQYELSRYVYEPEHKIFWEWINNKVSKKSNSSIEWPTAYFNEKEKIIKDFYYETPLQRLAPDIIRSSSKMKEILQNLRRLLDKID